MTSPGKLLLVPAMLLVGLVAPAADLWVQVSLPHPPTGATLLNIGYVVANGNGNRVATLRIPVGDFHMDMVIEFDCAAQRGHTLSSGLFDGAGHFVSGGGGDAKWYGANDMSGIAEACRAPLSKP